MIDEELVKLIVVRGYLFKWFYMLSIWLDEDVGVVILEVCDNVVVFRYYCMINSGVILKCIFVMLIKMGVVCC